MIPKKEYLDEDDIVFITKELLVKYHTPEELIIFNKWFRGQTGIMTRDGTLGVYAYDYERWIQSNMSNKQNPLSWD